MLKFSASRSYICILLLLGLSLPTQAADGSKGNEDINPVLDAPTTDLSAGIGVEFESLGFVFQSTRQCSEADTDAAKGHLLGGRQDRSSNPLWKLTGDTTQEIPGQLSGEYIIDGTQVKLGTNEAGSIAAAIHNDIITLDPSAQNKDDFNVVQLDEDGNVLQNKCNPWKIIAPKSPGTAKNLIFARQITAPLPLEAISDLIQKVYMGTPSSLLQHLQLTDVDVTKEFFQSSPQGISANSVTADVLGFLSIVLSYVKSPKGYLVNSSPKFRTTIMPRTDFTTMYNTVRHKMPVDLYELVKILACYRHDPYDHKSILLDEAFCCGTEDAPIPNDKIDSIKFTNGNKNGKPTSLTVRDWLNSISAGIQPDLLSEYDTAFDSQIGALGKKMEYIVGTQRAVPLLEFRSIGGSTSAQFQELVDKAEAELLSYHRQYAQAPPQMTRGRRTSERSRHVERQHPVQCPVSRPSPKAPTPTKPAISPSPTASEPPMPSCSYQSEAPDQGINTVACICGSKTLPLLTMSSVTAETQSCDYTAWPTTSVSNPIHSPTETWTTDCRACTLVGGIADYPNCTPVPGCHTTTAPTPTPTFQIFLSNNSVSVGEENNFNAGADLREGLYNQLRDLCPDDSHVCNTLKPAEFDHVPVVVGHMEESETLTFTITDSQYDSAEERDIILSAVVATWQQAVARSCKQVSFTDIENDSDGSGCGAARRLGRREVLPPPTDICSHEVTMCSGPNHITAIRYGKDGYYGQHIDISVDRKIEGEAEELFACELIIEGLAAAAMFVAPELLGAEVQGEVEFQALCEELYGGDE